ncbi:hypothetical protein FQZ97_968840 [compost metagenome]
MNHSHVASLLQQTGKQARDADRSQRPRPHLAIRLDAPKHRASPDPGRSDPVQDCAGRPPEHQRNKPTVVFPDSHRLNIPFALRLRCHQALRVRQAPARQGLRQQVLPPHQRHDGSQAQTRHVGPPTGLGQRRQPPLQQPGQRSHALEPRPRGPVTVERHRVRAAVKASVGKRSVHGGDGGTGKGGVPKPYRPCAPMVSPHPTKARQKHAKGSSPRKPQRNPPQ